MEMDASLFADLRDILFGKRIHVHPDDGGYWVVSTATDEERPLVRENVERYLASGYIEPTRDGEGFVTSRKGREWLAEQETPAAADAREAAYAALVARLQPEGPTHSEVGALLVEGGCWSSSHDASPNQAPYPAYLFLAMPFDALVRMQQVAALTLPAMRDTLGFQGLAYQFPTIIIPQGEVQPDIWEGSLDESPLMHVDGDDMSDGLEYAIERPLVRGDVLLTPEALTITAEVPDLDFESRMWWMLRGRASIPIKTFVEAVERGREEWD